jgi:hypothetical protein
MITSTVMPVLQSEDMPGSRLAETGSIDDNENDLTRNDDVEHSLLTENQFLLIQHS